MRKKYDNMAISGLTMMEMIISLVIMAVIFAAILPQFKNIQNSWASKQTNAEVLQNGRILISHLNQNLAKAAQITAVSDPCDTTGFIEFEGNDATTYRCEIGADNIVEFGPVGNLADLAGPVSQLQFTCYALDDLDTPTTDISTIRLVKVETIMTNTGPGQDKAFTASAYLQANVSGGLLIIQEGSSFEFDNSRASDPAVVKIDSTHYLCVYKGPGGDGWAVVLYVDSTDWTISVLSSFEFDNVEANTPSLARIDATHYLCAYADSLTVGNAIVLTVDPATWQITKESTFVFDTSWGREPVLAKIDQDHYLCTYAGLDSDGWAVVLTVDTGTWNISKETPFEYDMSRGRTPDLSKIDDEHYLCAYQGPNKDGWAVILKVDTGTWNISKGSAHKFNDISETDTPALARIDNTYYLCAYTNTMGGQQGWSILLAVDTATLTASSGNPLSSPNGGATPAAAAIDESGCLCAFAPTGTGFEGWSVILAVDPPADTITEGPVFKYDPSRGVSADFCRIDNDHYLCVYEGPGSDGWAVVLNVHGELRP